MRSAAILAGLAALGGCAGPLPPLAVPPSVLSGSWSASPGGAPIEADFWRRFGDPALAGVAARGRAADPGVAAAQARLRAARGLARIARAATLPSIGASAGVAATRTDNTNTALFSYSVGQAGLDIAYDTDLFRGARGDPCRACAGRRGGL